jgi:hypothetical protein
MPSCRLAGWQAVTGAAAVAAAIKAANWPGTWRSGPAGQPGRRRCDRAVPITGRRPAGSGPIALRPVPAIGRPLKTEGSAEAVKHGWAAAQITAVRWQNPMTECALMAADSAVPPPVASWSGHLHGKGDHPSVLARRYRSHGHA